MAALAELSRGYAIILSSMFASEFRKGAEPNFYNESALSSYSAFKKKTKQYFKEFPLESIQQDTLNISDYFSGDYGIPIKSSRERLDLNIERVAVAIFDLSFLSKYGFNDKEISNLCADAYRKEFVSAVMDVNNKTEAALRFEKRDAPTDSPLRDFLRFISTISLVAGGILAIPATYFVSIFTVMWILSIRTNRRKKNNYKSQVKLLSQYKEQIKKNDIAIISLKGVKAIYSITEKYIFGLAVPGILSRLTALCEKKGINPRLVLREYQNQLIRIHNKYYKEYELDIAKTESRLMEHKKLHAEITTRKEKEAIAAIAEKERKAKSAAKWEDRREKATQLIIKSVASLEEKGKSEAAKSEIIAEARRKAARESLQKK